MNLERVNELTFESTSAPDGLYVVAKAETYVPHPEFPLPSIDVVSSAKVDAFEIECNGFSDSFAYGDIVAVSNNRRRVSGILSKNAKQSGNQVLSEVWMVFGASSTTRPIIPALDRSTWLDEFRSMHGGFGAQ